MYKTTKGRKKQMKISKITGFDSDTKTLKECCVIWEQRFRQHNATENWQMYIGIKKHLGEYDTIDKDIKQTLSAMALLEANSKEPA
jgi:hypothetical protein